MARPSTTVGKTSAANTRKSPSVKGRKSSKTKRRLTSTALRSKRSSGSGLGNELKEAREQQEATAEILKVIASSPDDVQPVFEAIAASAKRLMGGHSAAVFRFIDGAAHLKAFTPTTRKADEVLKNEFPMPVSFFPLAQQNVLNGETEQIPDTEKGKKFQIKIARARGFRSIMFSPLMHQGTAIGMISITRREPGRFADHHVQLLRTFADQAVIAIVNARLFSELRQRTEDLRDSLQQQTGTADVLKIISRSAFDLATVLQTLVESAARLCEADIANIWRPKGRDFYLAASFGVPGRDKERLENARYLKSITLPPGRGSIVGRVLLEKRTVQVDDLQADPEYKLNEILRLGDYRTVLGVPLLREGVPIGVIFLSRCKVRPFSEKHIELVATFADQAVIAIENARLFDEVQAKTRDLEEALRYQTGSANILKVIASSPTDVGPVLTAIVESACELCNADDAVVHLRDGEELRYGAHHGALPVGFKRHAISRDFVAGRSVVDKSPVHIHDVLSGEGDSFPEAQRMSRQTELRTILSAPMLRESECIGAIVLRRKEVRPFTEKQIALLQTFADQAVIAIENARLFNEVQERTEDLAESLQQQTATSDLLQVISRSTFDLQPIFDAIAERAVRLCGASRAFIYRFDGELLHMVASHNAPEDFKAWVTQHPIPPGRQSGSGRAMLERRTIHIHDVRADPEYTFGAKDAEAIRTILGVPIMKGDEMLGVMMIYHIDEVRPFTEKQIALVETFADQAAIAIENVRLFNEVQSRTGELEEALQRQTATANVLEVINSSPGNLAPVFEMILQKAHDLYGVAFGSLQIYDGEYLRAVAIQGTSERFAELVRRGYRAAESPSGRAFLEGQRYLQIDDARESDFVTLRGAAELEGLRTVLYIPLRQEGRLLGTIAAARREVRPFSEKEIGILESFATQAAIAIENARLINETRESLQQQTATADVLKVISRSSVDLETVLDTLVETVARLCRADQTAMLRRRDNMYHLVAAHGLSAEVEEFQRSRPFAADRSTLSGRVALERRVVQIPDVLHDAEYGRSETQKITGYRTLLGVPLLREESLIGILIITRTRADPFTDKEIELATTFADQAVIAIENSRLFEELRERQAELARSVEELTATGDVLKIISRSAVELKTVLDTLVATAARLCHADQSQMFRRHGDGYHVAASYGASLEFDEWLSRNPLPIVGRGTATARAGAERRTIHIADVLVDPEYAWQEGQRLGGYRTVLAVPLLRGDTLIGFFTLLRTRVAPFTEKEIELVTTFADQAVIAIENARLFEELRDRQAELRVTFDNMGDGVVMFGADTRLVAWNRNFQTILDLPDTFLARRPSYIEYFQYLAERGEYSTDLEAELSRRLQETDQELRLERTRPDGRVIEARRNPVPGGGFVLIYADITERKRAEEAVRAARDAAESALRDLQTAQDRLVQTEKLASLGQLTAGIAHEIKNPLNFINNFSAISLELTDELKELLRQGELAKNIQEDVDQLTQILNSNLAKVVQHGKRADSIVKNMLLHSRQGSGERRPADINALVDESLNLAYHGARAEKQGFHITLEREFDAKAGLADLYPQEVTRVLLNLISNGFYAASQRAGTAGNDFEPRLKATTRNLGDKVEIRIRDNGMGIPPDIREKIFNPFFTTKPAGEGTGLGLSMSHDIVVKQHGGTIEVETEPGLFTEFIITLPRVLP